MSKQYGANVAGIVEAVQQGDVTLVTKISETIGGLEKMRAHFAKRRHAEFGKQIKPWNTGEESYDVLRGEDKTEQTISRTIKSLERMKDYAQAFDNMKPEALVAAVVAAEEKAVANA
jgi:hypothetical protein